MVEAKDIEEELGYEDIPDVNPKAKKPDKMTKEAQNAILKALEDGAFLTDAAMIAGVNRKTVYDWMKKGRAQRRGKYRNFVNAVDEARAKVKVSASKCILGAFDRDWKAAAHYLNATDPDRWGDRKKIDVSGSLDNRVTIEYINDYGKNSVDEANGDGGKV